MENLDAKAYREFVSEKGIRVVDMWAPWCGPCRAFAPAFSSVSKSMAGRATFAKLNVDEATEVALDEGVATIPTVVIYRDGERVAVHVGSMTASTLMSKVEDVVDAYEADYEADYEDEDEG